MRYLLEPYAARLAAPKIPEGQLDELRMRLFRLSEMKEDTTERRRYITEVDLFLHSIILENCGNFTLCNIVESYFPIIKRISFVNLYRHNRIISIEQEIRDIAKALEERDAKGAYLAMQVHLSRIKHAMD